MKSTGKQRFYRDLQSFISLREMHSAKRKYLVQDILRNDGEYLKGG